MGLENFQRLEGCKSCRDDPRTSIFHVKLKPEEHEMLYFVAEKSNNKTNQRNSFHQSSSVILKNIKVHILPQILSEEQFQH